MSAYLRLIGRRRGGRLFEAGRLLTFSAFKMGTYSRWALIRGWALIRINTITLLRVNQIAGITSDFKMDVIKRGNHFFLRVQVMICLITLSLGKIH